MLGELYVGLKQYMLYAFYIGNELYESNFLSA